MLYIDLKYLHFLQPKLPGFTRKKDRVFVCRCPLCGDSRTNQRKMRGYIYAWKDDLRYKCHNCDASHFFGDFLKMLDPYLYEQYRLEVFKEKYGSSNTRGSRQPDPEPPVQDTQERLANLKSIETIFHSICVKLSDLPASNAAVQYCEKRKIPKSAHERLYYIDDTQKLLQLVPDLQLKFSEKRLVLPFFDKAGNLVGMTCRSLDPNTKLRYLTIKLTDVAQVFGMDTVDPTKTIYVVEGPIDSLFLPNAIAVTGTGFGKVDIVLKELNIAADQVVVIIDNQPRNKEVVKILQRVIERGFNVVIWDIDDSKGKDINALIQDANMTPQEVLSIIKRCVCRGLEASMKFIQWKKC